MTKTTRMIGVILFAIGVMLILSVFFMARGLFDQPLVAKDAKTAILDRLGVAAVTMVWRALLLIVMSVCGALIGSKGVQLYIASIPHDQPQPGKPADPKPKG
jgi:uncharacterized membrane protein